MINTYKVVSPDGVEIDGVEFEDGEELELDSEKVSDLLESGSLAIVVGDEEEVVEGGDQTMDETPEVEDALPEEIESDEADVIADEPTEDDLAEIEESGLSYEGKKIVGEVTDEDIEGRVYKIFSVETGETYKLPEDEFNAEVK